MFYSITTHPTTTTLNPSQSLLHHSFLRRHPLLNSKQGLSSSFYQCCSKLKSTHGQEPNVSKKIILFDKAPILSEIPATEDHQQQQQQKKKDSPSAGLVKLKLIPRRVLSLLSNLPLAIGEMFSIAALMALGQLLSTSFKYPVELFRTHFDNVFFL